MENNSAIIKCRICGRRFKRWRVHKGVRYDGFAKLEEHLEIEHNVEANLEADEPIKADDNG